MSKGVVYLPKIATLEGTDEFTNGSRELLAAEQQADAISNISSGKGNNARATRSNNGINGGQDSDLVAVKKI